MLFKFVVLLCFVWAIGLAGSHTMGGYIHLLLVLAIALSVTRVVHDRITRPAVTA
jgi:hypothetical protein